MDAGQQTGISATNEERGRAIALAKSIRAALTTAGWPAPIFCTSPNGAHLFYQIDLPNDDEATELIKCVLAALGDKHDELPAHVDRGLFDANRIGRIPGTTGRKGDSTPERPHRRGELIAVPEELVPVTREQLEAVGAPKPTAIPARPWSRTGPVSSATGPSFERFDPTPDGVRTYLERHGVAVKKIRSKGMDSILDLAACPITGAATGTSVSVIVSTDGKVSYSNRHNRGEGLGWHDLREHFEPGFKAWVAGLNDRGAAKKAAGTTTPAGPATTGVTAEDGNVAKLAVKRAVDLMRLEFAPLKWIIRDILSEGYAVLVGRPKLGKSFLALDWCIAVAAGGYALGERKCERREVLYCGLEDSERRLQSRLLEVAGRDPIPAALHYLAAGDLPRFGQGGLEMLDEFLTAHPGVGLVVIDTYARVRPPKPKNADPYIFDYENGAVLADLARKHGVSILCVLHARKAPAEDFIDEASGTLGIAGSADVILVMRRARGSQDVALHITGKDVPEAGLGLRFDSSSKAWRIVGNLDEVQQTSERREVIELLKSGATLSPAQIAAELGAPVASIRHRLRTMLDQGVIAQAGYGKYKSVSTSIHSSHSIHSREHNSINNQR